MKARGVRHIQYVCRPSCTGVTQRHVRIIHVTADLETRPEPGATSDQLCWQEVSWVEFCTSVM